ncbi:bifunctional 4-hydroxy-2-oxoglutarate aldolase/2-dehydro-3-deoxy-phosphogluconate aldolase [Synechococcus sp. M16CYN]|uniref:bifunctional 4-hydroxy-2-oxoglutarate aldolase/2-dehydro-3-deoxy-phosphogluconate aldolase n=1 Tax=Synechococcus sp. M16CYN TaxID=3103139 RepID=UPI0032472830
MTSGLLNTSDSYHCTWLARQEALIASLRSQPLLLVVRPAIKDLTGSSNLLIQLHDLHEAGLRHIELAWSSHSGWIPWVKQVRQCCPRFQLAAASITAPMALFDLQTLDFAYAMSPCWDPTLVSLARDQGILLVPGVFSPTEVHQAVSFGCRLVKLFPAITLGISYWNRLAAPLGSLPFVIAAGGLTAHDLSNWLSAGYDAVALGHQTVGSDGVDPKLFTWLTQVSNLA